MRPLQFDPTLADAVQDSESAMWPSMPALAVAPARVASMSNRPVSVGALTGASRLGQAPPIHAMIC